MQKSQRNAQLSRLERFDMFITGRQLADTDFLSRSDPFVKVWIKRNEKWVHFGSTEALRDTLNPEFTKTFPINYIPDMKQEVVFEVRDVDSPTKSELIGTTTCMLKDIVENDKKFTFLTLHNVPFDPNQKYNYESNQKNRGQLIVFVEKLGTSRDTVKMHWKAKGLKNTDGIFSKSDPILRIFRDMGGHKWLKVYESEVIKSNLNPDWQKFEINFNKLCINKNSDIKITVMDWEPRKDYQFIGEKMLNYQTLSDRSKSEFHITEQTKTKVKDTGLIILEEFSVKALPTLQDFLDAGDELHAMVAVDRRLDSIQHCSAHLNVFLKYFKNSGSVKMMTYGANSQHFKKIEGDTYLLNEAANDVDGIINTYNYALSNSTFEKSGGTNGAHLGPVIREVTKDAWDNKSKETGKFIVLLVLASEGQVIDKNDIISMMGESLYMPFFVVVLNTTGKVTNTLDFLIPENGKIGNTKLEREIVQCFNIQDIMTEQSIEHAFFGEIPDAIVDYNILIHRQPKKK